MDFFLDKTELQSISGAQSPDDYFMLTKGEIEPLHE
jgi:hypothetical protein